MWNTGSVDPWGPGPPGPDNNLHWAQQWLVRYFKPFAFLILITWSSLAPVLSSFKIDEDNLWQLGLWQVWPPNILGPYYSQPIYDETRSDGQNTNNNDSV